MVTKKKQASVGKTKYKLNPNIKAAANQSDSQYEYYEEEIEEEVEEEMIEELQDSKEQPPSA